MIIYKVTLNEFNSPAASNKWISISFYVKANNIDEAVKRALEESNENIGIDSPMRVSAIEETDINIEE